VPVVWKRGLAVIHQVVLRFKIGRCDPKINPKYTHIGWNYGWKNDEW